MFFAGRVNCDSFLPENGCKLQRYHTDLLLFNSEAPPGMGILVSKSSGTGGDRVKIGVLTGGGDCPGLNAVIRAVVRKADANDSRVVGIRNGWKGLLDLSYTDLDVRMVSGILHIGGTIIGTSRTNPLKDPAGAPRASCTSGGFRWSASPRRSTTTSSGPTSPSGSTRRSPSPPTRSTASIQPPRPTAGS